MSRSWYPEGWADTISVSSEVVDLTKSRSPTVDDETYVPGRKTKRSSRVGTSEKDTPVKRVKKSEAPPSTSSSKNVPVVELPLRPRTSAVAFETEQEDMEHPAADVMPMDDSGDRLMRLYTNDEDFEDYQNPPEVPQDFDAGVEVEVEEATVPPPSTNKRSAPASSPPADQSVTGRQKRVRIDSVAASINSPSAEINTPAKVATKSESQSGDTPGPENVGSKDKEGTTKGSAAGTAEKNIKIKSLAPVRLPTDLQFRALLPNTNDSSQSTTSTGLGQSQQDPIQQFPSPDRVSLNGSKVAATTAGPSKLAKGVHTVVVDGEEVLGVDTDSEGEGGLEPEPVKSQDIAMDADIVDEILAPVEVGSLVEKWGCTLM